MRRFLLGLAGGFTAGYIFYRSCQSLVMLARPLRKRTADAAAYGALRRALATVGIARSLAAAGTLAFGPLGEALNRRVRKWPVWLAPMGFAAQALAIDALAELPVDFVEGFAVEHRYELSEQSLASWFGDRCKQDAIGAAVTLALTGLFGTALRRWPRRWPLVASAAVFPLMLLANIVVPLYIMPLFNEYHPITGALERRLRMLASRYAVGGAQILRVDMSKQTKKANAFVIGIGTTHRIVVGDTLIEHFPEDEVEFVVAHELGHYLAKDSWRLIGMGQIVVSAMLFASYYALGESERSSPGSPRTLARIQWWSVLFTQLLRPAVYAFARSREWAADRFALEATRAPRTGAAAFRRLRDQNLAEDEQPAWFEFLFSTHPSLKARIDALSQDG